MNKKIGYLSFSLLFILVMVMGWATWQEHIEGTRYIEQHYYQAWWFNVLWGVIALFGLFYIIKRKLFRKLPVFFLHISLIIILLGAVFTRFNGKTGTVFLREKEENNSFFCEEEQKNNDFPFSLLLKAFRIEYYPGTTSPSNYVSVVQVIDRINNVSFEKEISMNKILKYEGYRFYQSSFDADMKGSVLSVNRDPIGIFFTYAGYFLLFFSMMWVLFDKRGRFIELLKKQSQRNIVILIMLFVFYSYSTSFESYAQESSYRVRKTGENKFNDENIYRYFSDISLASGLCLFFKDYSGEGSGNTYSLQGSYYFLPNWGVRSGFSYVNNLSGMDYYYKIPLLFSYRSRTVKMERIDMDEVENFRDILLSVFCSLIPAAIEADAGMSFGYIHPDVTEYHDPKGNPVLYDGYQVVRKFAPSFDANLKIIIPVWRFGVYGSVGASYLFLRNFEYHAYAPVPPDYNNSRTGWLAQLILGGYFRF